MTSQSQNHFHRRHRRRQIERQAGANIWRRDLVANMIGHWFVDFIGNVLPRLLP